MKSILDSDIRAGDTIHFTVLEPFDYPEWILLAMQRGEKNPYIYLTPHELYLVPKGEAEEASGAPEVEITPAMIEAGLDILWEYDLSEPKKTELREAIARIYLAMRKTPS